MLLLVVGPDGDRRVAEEKRKVTEEATNAIRLLISRTFLSFSEFLLPLDRGMEGREGGSLPQITTTMSMIMVLLVLLLLPVVMMWIKLPPSPLGRIFISRICVQVPCREE